MQTTQITVGIDIGSYQHRVVIAVPMERFWKCLIWLIIHWGFAIFSRAWRFMDTVRDYRSRLQWKVSMVMRGYPLYNVNNLKLARFKEIFPEPAKSDPIDAHKILELFQLRVHLPLAKGVLQEVAATPAENAQLKRLTLS
jgi:hypothetical protein